MIVKCRKELSFCVDGFRRVVHDSRVAHANRDANNSEIISAARTTREGSRLRLKRDVQELKIERDRENTQKISAL